MRIAATILMVTAACTATACGSSPLTHLTDATASTFQPGAATGGMAHESLVSVPRATADDVTGTWFVDGTPAITLVQRGSAITGAALYPPLPQGTSVTTNVITGTISGRNVTLDARLGMSIDLEGFSMTVSSDSRFTLQVADAQTMTGTAVTTSTCTGSLCPPASGPEHWSGQLTRGRSATTTPSPQPLPPDVTCIIAGECIPAATFSIDPVSVTVPGRLSTCTAGSIATSINVTARDDLNWNAEISMASLTDYGITAALDRPGGTGSGTVTLTIVSAGRWAGQTCNKPSGSWLGVRFTTTEDNMEFFSAFFDYALP